MKDRVFEIFTYLIFGAIVFITAQKYFPKTILLPVEKIEHLQMSASDKAFELGAKDGLKFIYIYSYDCKYCYEMNDVIENIYENYKNEVSFYFLNKLHLDNQTIFEISIFSECMLNYDLKNYFKASGFIYEQLLNNTLKVSSSNIINKYWELTSKDEKVSECISLEETFSTIHNKNELIKSYEIIETPAIIINNNLLKGVIDYKVLESIIENYLNP